MTNAPLPPDAGQDLAAAPADPVADRAKAPAHRGRRIAAAVSAGAFAGIALGLVVTQAGADDDTPTAPVAGDDATSASPFDGPFGDDGAGAGPGDQVGPPEQFGGPTGQFGDPSDGSGGSTDQFGDSTGGAATPAPFGGQTAPDTNSGGS